MPVSREDIILCLFQTVGTLVDVASRAETYAPGHRLKTAQIARTIAQLMGFDKDEIDGVRMAATLHDLGNVLLPANLLAKPDRFTAEEFSLVKEHVNHGVKMLKDIDFPWPVVDIVAQHHERLDGSGYPHGLKNDEILAEARVLAVADAMEAMTSARPWRPALSVGAALAEIIKGRGVTFDMVVVDACVELYTKQKYRLDPDYYGRA